MKPSGALPARSSWSLTSATTDEKIGDAHDVPATDSVRPPTTICTSSPIAATSGYARPVLLYSPALVVPSFVRYAATAVVCQEGCAK
jgi:hypothetical protein